jgi:putative pyruvate formate lyase activating enzyme
MPEDVSGTSEVLTFVANEISPDTCINVMDQYRPCYRADENPTLDRPITRAEYARALALAERLGLRRLA